MNSTDSTAHPLAADGGVTTPPESPQDPFGALFDLMVVVEALCPVWPQRDTFRESDRFVL